MITKEQWEKVMECFRMMRRMGYAYSIYYKESLVIGVPKSADYFIIEKSNGDWEKVYRSKFYSLQNLIESFTIVEPFRKYFSKCKSHQPDYKSEGRG